MYKIGDHLVRTESDEVVCTFCRKRWDPKTDTPPSCLEEDVPHEYKVCTHDGREYRTTNKLDALRIHRANPGSTIE